MCCVLLLFLEVLNFGLANVSFLNCGGDSLQIEKFSLGPMVDINVGVLQFVGHLIQGRKDFSIVSIGKNQLIRVHVRVVLQVHVFVACCCLV